MRFTLVDRIVALDPGSTIVAVKSPSMSEEYLQDHFPLFPVMPGVLMLEAMYQASAWLIRVTDDFADSLVLMKEARNVKYSGFVQPGQTLQVQADLFKREGNESKLKVEGRVEGRVVVSARLVLEQKNFADDNPEQATIDTLLRKQYRKELATIFPVTDGFAITAAAQGKPR